MSKRQIAEEELKRALLLMKYDNRKTLSENIDEQLGTAAAVGAGTGAAIGAASTGAVLGHSAIGVTAASIGSALGVGAAASMAIIGGLAGIALVPLAYWLITKDTGAERIKNIFQMCSTDSSKIAKLERKIDDKTIRNLSDQIYDATEGLGTNEESLFGAFESLRDGTASDACALVNRFNRDHGDLFEWLDDDIDASSEWERIYRPFRDCVEDSLLKLKDENPCKEGEIFDDKQQKCVPISPTPDPTPVPTQWRECEFPLVVGCKGENVRKVQECIGIDADGKFGKKTKTALNNNGYGDDVSKEDYDKIIEKCGGSTPSPTPTPIPYEVNPSTEPAKDQD